MIWVHRPTVQQLNELSENTMSQLLGIEFTEVGDDYLIARMPVDDRTRQPLGRLHGGASAALAETVGSYAALFTIDDPTKGVPVGVSISSDHINGITEGMVFARAEPIRIGRRIQFWRIDIYREDETLICASRLTVTIIRP